MASGGGLGWRGRGLGARDTLILAFSHEGRRDPLATVWGWFRVAGLVRRLGARASRPHSRAWARRAFIIAFSHEGRRDPRGGVWAWFWVAGLAGADAG